MKTSKHKAAAPLPQTIAGLCLTSAHLRAIALIVCDWAYLENELLSHLMLVSYPDHLPPMDHGHYVTGLALLDHYEEHLPALGFTEEAMAEMCDVLRIVGAAASQRETILRALWGCSPGAAKAPLPFKDKAPCLVIRCDVVPENRSYSADELRQIARAISDALRRVKSIIPRHLSAGVSA